MPESKPRAPTLSGIIVVKCVKGVVFTLLGLLAYAYSDNNLPEEYRHLLQWLHVNPEGRLWVYLAEKLGHVSAGNLLLVAAATLGYGAIALIEGIGLWLRVSWASWMAIGEAGVFIPLEIYKLLHRFSRGIALVLVLNLVIFWYLLLNRKRLFRRAPLRIRHSPRTPASIA